jgi:hypothetical protein
MKQFRLVILIIALTGFFVTSSNAQSKSFSDVLSFQLKSSGTITDNEEIKGYYFFYKKDKVNRKMNSYLLTVLDQNLNEIGSKTMTDSKYLILQDVTYNGSKIMMKFFQAKSREISYRVFDNDGKLSKTETKVVSKKDARYFNMGTAEPTQPNSLFAVNNKGFVDYIIRQNKRIGYEMEFLPTDGSKGWVFKSDAETKMTQSAGFLYANNDILLSSLMVRKKLTSSKGMQFYVQANDIKDGKERWKTLLEDPKFEISLLNTYMDKEKNQIVLFGSYFEKGAKLSKAKSLGLFSFIVDVNTGEIQKRNFISWIEDAGKFLEINDKGKIKSVGYVYFHEFIKTADGRIFAVGEQYRKAVSAGGIALGVLAAAGGGTSNASIMKLVIEDFYIFEFNQDFTLKDIKVFEKGKSNIILPAGFLYLSPATIAMYMKAIGQFDFYFTQKEDGGEVVHIGYLDYDKTQEKNEKVYFGALSYADGEFSTDKIPLVTKKKTSITVLPGKPGHVMVMEYNRKTKTLDIRMERINY